MKTNFKKNIHLIVSVSYIFIAICLFFIESRFSTEGVFAVVGLFFVGISVFQLKKTKMHFVLHAVLRILSGIVLIAATSIVGGIFALIMFFIGLHIAVTGFLLFTREEWGVIAPGRYYIYTCVHCGGKKRSYERSLRGEVTCIFCGDKWYLG